MFFANMYFYCKINTQNPWNNYGSDTKRDNKIVITNTINI